MLFIWLVLVKYLIFDMKIIGDDFEIKILFIFKIIVNLFFIY